MAKTKDKKRTAKKKVAPDFVRRLRELVTKSCYAEYDSNSTTWCDGSCEDYCRCSRIINTKVTEVYIASIVSKMVKDISDPIRAYCFSRLLMRSELFDPGLWEVDICNGYYGEETEGASFDARKLNELEKVLTKFLKIKKHRLMVEFTLKNEYGYILPALENQEWQILDVPTGKVILSNQDHYQRLDQSVVDMYKDKEWQKLDLPHAVVCLSNGNLRLIDGYHRWVAAKHTETMKVLVAK